jgi:hypothetical protein
MDERGPLGFKSGEAPEYIKDKVARETGKVFSDETDYIIHHPGDKLFYLRRKTGDDKVPNEYLNFTISDAEIDAAKKPTITRGIYMTQEIPVQQETVQEINNNETQPDPMTTPEPIEPVAKINETDRLISRKNILSRIAEQYRTQEDKDELAQIELKLQGTTPAVISPEAVNNNQETKPEAITTGTLGTIAMPIPQTESAIEVVNEPYIETLASDVQPISPAITQTNPEPIVTEMEPVTIESPEVVENVKPEPSLIQQATSVVDIHNALEKMDGIETLTSHVSFAEAWDKTKKFMAGEITKAELPDNDEFLEKLIELKKAHDDELALLGISTKQSTEIKDIADENENEDVTEIIKPRHVISGNQINIMDDQDELTAGLSQSEVDRFNMMFGNIAPAKKVELTTAVSIPLKAESAPISVKPTIAIDTVETSRIPENKINRGKLGKKYQYALYKIFNVGNRSTETMKPVSVDLAAVSSNQNDTMTAIGKKSPEVWFS